MSDRFQFSPNGALIPNLSMDGGIVWTQDSLSTSLGDSITEGYVTAEEENATQYLSVLDNSSEISLEHLNIALEHSKLDEQETLIPEQYPEQETRNEGLVDDQQVVLFTVEGSNELYGIQVAQDEEGNLQRYQFQLRRNETGQLEAIPETIQLLPPEEEEEETVNPSVEYEQVDSKPEYEDINNALNTQGVPIFVNQDGEHVLPDSKHDPEEFLYETQQQEEGDEEEEDSVDVKPALLALHHIKQEIHEQFKYDNPEFEPEHAFEENAEQSPDELEQEETLEAEQQVDTENTEELDQSFENVEVNPDVDAMHLEPEDSAEDEHCENTNNDSDLDDYNIVEGVHVTGDLDSAEPQDDKSDIVNGNILRQDDKENRQLDRTYLYVMPRAVHSEKENVDALTSFARNIIYKPNPRSVLKSSHALPQQVQVQLQPQQNTKTVNKPALIHKQNNACQETRLISKRFARGKEAIEAKNFHNFINKTTIPEVPVRTTRLPRKQAIKPVERMDEEIVVQEVMISGNGFVQAIKGAHRASMRRVTEYVELSDSDEEDQKEVKKTKKKRRKKRADSNDSGDDSSEGSVIDLLDSDSEEEEVESTKESRDEETTSSGVKKRRSPRNAAKTLESPSKKTRVESSASTVSSSDVATKPEIPCPKCDKSFPSQNSLKTHLQHHNLQSSFRKAMDDYKCPDCGNAYKNAALLKRHTCLKHACSICKKKFSDLSSLTVHKRSHAKEQLVKCTSAQKISPKKMLMRPPSSTTVAKKKENNHKCQTCGKFCSSAENLTTHLKSHKEFVCLTCSAKFMSRIMLDKHVRENCVKTPITRRSTRINTPGCAGVPAANRLTHVYRNLHLDLMKKDD